MFLSFFVFCILVQSNLASKQHLNEEIYFAGRSWEKKNLEKQVLNADKRLVVDGIHHSMRKFDDIETYKKTEDDLEKYITMLRNEVRRHYVEEKQIEDNLEDDNPILEFINDVVKKIAIKKANPQ